MLGHERGGQDLAEEQKADQEVRQNEGQEINQIMEVDQEERQNSKHEYDFHLPEQDMWTDSIFGSTTKAFPDRRFSHSLGLVEDVFRETSTPDSPTLDPTLSSPLQPTYLKLIGELEEHRLYWNGLLTVARKEHEQEEQEKQTPEQEEQDKELKQHKMIWSRKASPCQKLRHGRYPESRNNLDNFECDPCVGVSFESREKNCKDKCHNKIVHNILINTKLELKNQTAPEITIKSQNHNTKDSELIPDTIKKHSCVRMYKEAGTMGFLVLLSIPPLSYLLSTLYSVSYSYSSYSSLIPYIPFPLVENTSVLTF